MTKREHANPSPLTRIASLLPALRAAGLDFATVPVSVWLQQLKEAAATHKGDADVKRNPALKLVDYFERTYSGTGDMTQKSGLEFDTRKTQQHSDLGAAPKIIEDGYVEKFFSRWMSRWEAEGKPLQADGKEPENGRGAAGGELAQKRKRDAEGQAEGPAVKRVS